LESDVKHIRDATEKMKHLLDDLLELSRVGRLINPPEAVSLAELAEEARVLVGGQIAERGAQINIAPNLPIVFGDRPRLLEVLQNLIDNAVKYLGHQPEPRIDIGVREAGGETIIYVHDNGIGIEPQYHEKVFGLFERLEQDTEGTGIGLALVKRIVELHGGRIWVESNGGGQGSTFCFTLEQNGQSS
jgi:signal transduction histidine kinase